MPGRDNRIFHRHSLQLDVQVSAKNVKPCQAKIRDFCLGGSFLTFVESGIAGQIFKANDLITVHLKVPTQSGSLNFHMHARITRIEGNAVGVSFAEPDPAALQALQNLSNIINEHAHEITAAEEQALGNSGTQRILALCRRCLTDHLSVLLQGFFPNVEDALLEAADKATNNTLQRELYDTIPLIKKNRGPIVTGFNKRAMEVLDFFSGGNKAFNDVNEPALLEDEQNLSLVSQDDFEDWLVVKMIISKAETNLHESLFELRTRFSHLLNLTIDEDNNPVAPQVICHAFAETIGNIHLAKISEKIIFSCFEESVVNNLGGLYNDVNDVLINSGILPKIERSKYQEKPKKTECVVSAIRAQPFDDESTVQPVEKQKSLAQEENNIQTVKPDQTQAIKCTDAENKPSTSPEAEQRQEQGRTKEKLMTKAANENNIPQPDSKAGEAVTPLEAINNSQQETLPNKVPNNLSEESPFQIQNKVARQAFSTIQNIVDIKKQGFSKSNADAVDSGPEKKYAQRKDVLQALNQLTKDEVNDSKSSVIESVKQLLVDTYGDDSALSDKHAQVLNGIEDLYNAMFDTDRLTEHMRGNFENLKLPISKVVVQDDSFFENVQHPVRRVLNRLAQLGTKGGIENVRTQSSVDKVVDQIKAQYVDDLQVFEHALSELDQLFERQQSLYNRNVNRLTEACEGQQKIDLAKKAVDNAINQRIGGKTVPKAVPLLLQAGWRDTMNHAYIRQGPESEAWNKNLDVIDLLMIKLGAENNFNPVNQESNVSGSEVFKTIQQQLENVVGHQRVNQRALDELGSILQKVDEDPDQKLDLVNVPLSTEDDNQELVTDTDSFNLDRYIKKAKSLKLGDWLKHIVSDTETTKMRLVWLGKEHSKFVFVNHQGMKVTEFTLYQMAIAFSEGNLILIPEGDLPLVEHGLDKMIEDVYDELAFQTSHDQLTGLMNRQEFERRLQKVIDGSLNQQHALCYLDLDQFKVVNNTCGFEAGDKLLLEISEVLQSWMSADGFIGRLGGDEFGIFIENTSEADAYQIADNQMNAVQEYRFVWDDKPFSLAVSIGLVFISDSNQESAQSLLKAANAACDAAKEGGRNRIEVYNSEDTQFAERDDVMAWVTRLNQALDENRIKLRCQQIAPIAATDYSLPHYEVLLGVQDESGLQLPPADFIYAAEQYNRMQAVDRWVISNVFHWMVDNKNLLENMAGLAINLSGHSFNDELLLAFIWEKFVEMKVPRDKVIFEVTETATIANLERAADFIREMKGVGCKFALDDFGSGLSSYAYLKNLPVDYVKIDGVFVKDIASDKSDYAMVKSINEMAKFLGKRTIAEYVENNDILEKLKEIGIDYAQGWGIEKPVMLDELNEEYFIPEEQSALF